LAFENELADNRDFQMSVFVYFKHWKYRLLLILLFASFFAYVNSLFCFPFVNFLIPVPIEMTERSSTSSTAAELDDDFYDTDQDAIYAEAAKICKVHL
jgi:hypothetical protein